jgi:Tol biopolymer transport system component
MSPDGRMLAFVRGRDPFLFGASELYVKLLPDGQPVALTHDATPKMAPTFTPDGANIVFTDSDGWSSFSVPVAGGTPALFMPHAAGLRWIAAGQVLFSELRRPPNMSVVTATESRGQPRDVYVPASPQGMAHFTERSPDGKWVLVVEMDTNAWMPCRLVPFDGSSAGRRVGPPGAECTSATWSPDGRWMYFAAGVNNESHLWRQRVPDGVPEQLTSGTSQERGVVVDRDGRSVITAVGAAQSVVWYHDEAGERPVSTEGYAYRPLVSPDGRRVFYLIRREARRSFSIGELWATDLVTGRNERILQEFLVRSYDISSDGKTVVFDAFDETDRSRMWLAPTDRSAAPRRLTPDGPVEEQRPFFGSSGDIYFMREEPSRRPSLYRMSPDGSTRQKKSDDVTFLISVSPDEHWAAVWDGGTTRLLSLVDGASRTLCSCSTGPIFPDSPRVRWSGDGQTLFVNLGYADEPGGGTVMIPWRGADSVAAGVSRAPADLRKRAGTRLLGESSVAPGPTGARYAFARQAEQSNLYRIQLP